MSYICYGHQVDLSSPVGGKARALATLAVTDVLIPEWFVVLPMAFHDSLLDSQKQDFQDHIKNQDGQAITALIHHMTIAQPIADEVLKALDSSSNHQSLYAVRSSAQDEDGIDHSFAGQFDSFLFVSPDAILEKIKAVWASAFSERLSQYRVEHDLPWDNAVPGVLVQRMIDSTVAGVAFAGDPVSGRRSQSIVSGVYGLGSGLVSGECDADTYSLDRTGKIIHRQIAQKTHGHRADSNCLEGVRAKPVAIELQEQPCLNDQEILAVVELTKTCSRHFGRPQDIEWAIADGKLYLLQSRPITSLANLPDPDGKRQLWDNSNIAESYNGITTPLTFSFARRIYEAVYREFCHLLSVPKKRITTNNSIFPRMLGLIRGRVYYNLLNWYRLLSLLPGFQSNRQFMEQMMGVKEGLPEYFLSEFSKATWMEKMIDRVYLTRSVMALIWNHWTMKSQIRKFYRRLSLALGDHRPDLSRWRADELVDYFNDLERQLLKKWDAPLTNDFFAMIFYGVLGKLTKKWCGDDQGTLQNNLLCAEGGMVSAEPAQRVIKMANLAVQHDKLCDSLCLDNLSEIQQTMVEYPAFQNEYESYLEKFGDRCLEELKLESLTLFDDPLTLLRSIGQMSRRLKTTPLHGSLEKELRQQAEETVHQSLGYNVLKRGLFYWVLKNARNRVRDRENLRFERTRLFGRVRQIVLEIGKRFFSDNILDHPRDVFYLELSEIFGFIDGTATCTKLKDLARLRKQEFAQYESSAPDERFETLGMVNQGNTFTTVKEKVIETGDSRKGIGCCPGVVRSRVRVITDPRNANLEVGEIIVAERTDPGWIMLFPSASGLLVERGSLLSHSAIVAREMGIPAIVSLSAVTQWLKDGDEVEMDGATGTVRKLKNSEADL